MQKQITPAALALSALLLTACAAAPVESVATVETAPEPAPQVLTAYAADGLAPALQAYADAQGVALNWTDDASTASLLALDHQPDGTTLDVTSDPLLAAAAARANITGSAASLPAGRSLYGYWVSGSLLNSLLGDGAAEALQNASWDEWSDFVETREDAPALLEQLIMKTGGMDVFLLSSGIGKQNLSLCPDIELQTAATNVSGFIRMVNAAYHYFEQQGKGHIAVISSIAGTKGLGSAPAYSATKRFQNTYLDALDQLAHMNKLHISFTDIRPGFVATPLLKDDKYPLLMHAPYVASQIVRAISRRKRVAVIDRRYQMLVFFWKLIPGWLWVRLPVRNQ